MMVISSSVALALRLEGGSGTTDSSRSLSKVEADSQPVAGPDPLTVSAEILTCDGESQPVKLSRRKSYALDGLVLHLHNV